MNERSVKYTTENLENQIYTKYFSKNNKTNATILEKKQYLVHILNIKFLT